VTHLVDTSVWHKYGRFSEVAAAVDELDKAGAIFSTCPPVVAEYCFSARNVSELASMQNEMAQFYQLDVRALTQTVHHIQMALVRRNLHRAVGASDVVIAAYAMSAEQVLVTCDRDFLHIASALRLTRNLGRLHVTHIDEAGYATTA
jgi:predicted nucleic acid-binding protein